MKAVGGCRLYMELIYRLSIDTNLEKYPFSYKACSSSQNLMEITH